MPPQTGATTDTDTGHPDNEMTASRRLLFLSLFAAADINPTESLVQSSRNAEIKSKTISVFRRLSATSTTSSTPFFAWPRSRDSNWEDDTRSSRTNSDVTDYLPPWRDHQGSSSSSSSSKQIFSGSQAIPGKKNRPFEAFWATPQENVSPQAAAAAAPRRATPPPAISAPRGGDSSPSNLLVHGIKWPLIRDPPGVSSDFPLLMTRIIVTVISTIATWYLHFINAYSPVLASSAIALLVSTCLDRRLGQAAMCGSFAGMCGGHMVPQFSNAVLLGALTSACYEVLIHINNLCLGIGGRLGATAFLATSIFAKYRGVSSVGRKVRRGLWKSGTGPSSILITMVLYHVIGSLATIFLRESSDDSAAADPIRASSVVGLLGSLYLKDPSAVLALYGGSFVGMSLPSRLMYGNAPGQAKTNQPQTALSLFTSFAGAGAIAGLIHAITIHNGYWNGGWGGKAGLCAFAGCGAYRGIGNAVEFMTKQK